MKLASRRRRIALPGGGAVSAVVALPPGFRRPGRTPAVILAHGAGSDMTNPCLTGGAAGLAREGLVAVKFNFPYTEARRRAPDPRPVLQRCYRAVVDAVLGDRRLAPPWVAIGGKSLGGRIASYVAADGAPVRGLLFLGYPLHPAGRSDELRADHLPGVALPMLFVQGTRDALCELERLRPVLARLPRAPDHPPPPERRAPTRPPARRATTTVRPAAGEGPGSPRPPHLGRHLKTGQRGRGRRDEVGDYRMRASDGKVWWVRCATGIEKSAC